MSESNEIVKKNLTNKFNVENVKKNLSRRNLSVKINLQYFFNINQLITFKNINTNFYIK